MQSHESFLSHKNTPRTGVDSRTSDGRSDRRGCLPSSDDPSGDDNNTTNVSDAFDGSHAANTNDAANFQTDTTTMCSGLLSQAATVFEATAHRLLP
jgi:hypothetical protein